MAIFITIKTDNNQKLVSLLSSVFLTLNALSEIPYKLFDSKIERISNIIVVQTMIGLGFLDIFFEFIELSID